MAVILTCIFAACDKTNVDDEKHTKQVPVYKGMTISDSFAGTSATVASDDNGNHYGHFKGDHNDRDDEVDQNKPFEDPNAPSIENKANSTLDVVGSAESIYYAGRNAGSPFRQRTDPACPFVENRKKPGFQTVYAGIES